VWRATTSAKSVKSLVRPTLEYIYIPVKCGAQDISTLENVQYQAARRACGCW